MKFTRGPPPSCGRRVYNSDVASDVCAVAWGRSNTTFFFVSVTLSTRSRRQNACACICAELLLRKRGLDLLLVLASTPLEEDDAPRTGSRRFNPDYERDNHEPTRHERLSPGITVQGVMVHVLTSNSDQAKSTGFSGQFYHTRGYIPPWIYVPEFGRTVPQMRNARDDAADCQVAMVTTCMATWALSRFTYATIIGSKRGMAASKRDITVTCSLTMLSLGWSCCLH